MVQLLDNEQQIIPSADKHVLCSKKQAAHIIQNSIGHVGVDSIYCNFAGQFCVPLVGIYSHTNLQNTQPWKLVASKTKFLSSVKEGEKPSYDPNETPQTINTIFPEEIAKNILAVLKIKSKIKFKTLLIGERYGYECVDIVPTLPCKIQANQINVRMDIFHNEDNLKDVVSRNVVEVTLSNPISDEILNSRRISLINYLSQTFDAAFVAKVKSLGIHINLLCVCPESLAQQRLEFFDYDVNFYDLKTISEENSKKFEGVAAAKIKTKSKKKIFVGDKSYNTYLEACNSKGLFLLDLDWLYLYTDEHE
jgi:hypothetical protein